MKNGQLLTNGTSCNASSSAKFSMKNTREPRRLLQMDATAFCK